MEPEAKRTRHFVIRSNCRTGMLPVPTNLQVIGKTVPSGRKLLSFGLPLPEMVQAPNTRFGTCWAFATREASVFIVVADGFGQNGNKSVPTRACNK